jgi:hypothetical protein
VTAREHVSARELAARDELAARLLPHPAVSMVDLGLDADGGAHVLRVHVRSGERLPPVPIPADVAGIPVRVVGGDYALE